MIGPSLQHPEEGLACPLSSSDLAASVIVQSRLARYATSKYFFLLDTFFCSFQLQISGPHLYLHLFLACHALPCALGTRLSSSASGVPERPVQFSRPPPPPFFSARHPFVLVPSLGNICSSSPPDSFPLILLSPFFFFSYLFFASPSHSDQRANVHPRPPPTIQTACCPAFRHLPTCTRKQNSDCWHRNKPAPHGRLHPPSPTP